MRSGATTIINLLVLSSVATALLVSDDFIQQLFTTHNQSTLESAHVLGMFAFSLGLWWSRSRLLVMVVLGLFAIMQFLQLSYIAYVGQPLNPIDISLISKEWSEIAEVAGSAWRDHWSVILAVGLPYGILFWLFWRFLPTFVLRSCARCQASLTGQ